jgi:hypothetical protein
MKNTDPLRAAVAVIILLIAFVILGDQLIRIFQSVGTEGVVFNTPTTALTDTPTSSLSGSSYEPESPYGFFVVVYPGRDGVNVRTGPGLSYSEIGELARGERLEVFGQPTQSRDGIRWWPVSSAFGEGWVAEWFGDWRLIKPEIAGGDIAVVTYPSPKGRVSLRNEDCEETWYLAPGTELYVLAGPDAARCYPDSALVSRGREWWYVQTADGTREGWIADFSSDNLDSDTYGTWRKIVLVAPQWYAELSNR